MSGISATTRFGALYYINNELEEDRLVFFYPEQERYDFRKFIREKSKIKIEKCKKCVDNNRCEGFWKEYLSDNKN